MKALGIIAALFSMALPLRAAQPDWVNGIAVIVNDAVITFKDVYVQIAPDIEFLERRYGHQPQVLDQKVKELQAQKIEELVESQLILHEFKTGQYVMPESLIEARIEEEIKKFGDRLTLTKTLQAQGITFETFRTRIRERTILELMWRTKVPYDPLVSPSRIEKYYFEHRDEFKLEDQVKLRMIVLTNRPNETAYAPVRLCREIQAKIKEGAPFAEMARIYSNGSQAVEGGDWGWIERKVLRQDLAQTAFSLKPGQMSDVIETTDGAYLMLVEDAKIAYTKTLAEVRDEIEQTLKTEENKRLRKQWIERLKQKSFVRYF